MQLNVKQRAELEHLQGSGVEGWLSDLLRRALDLIGDYTEAYPAPEPHCSCHLHPPCSDCVDNGYARELNERAAKLLGEV